MFKFRTKNDRGITKNNWLESYHTFSFSQYFDPYNMGFSDLRVINDDTVLPAKGFGAHKHDNMEIVSIVLKGELEHKDSLGNGSVIRPFDIQKMTAGTGIIHSEFNPSLSTPVHFLQIWIFPNKQQLKPSYEQKTFSKSLMINKFITIASETGKNGSLQINQDAQIYQTILEQNASLDYSLPKERKIWIQVAYGGIYLNDKFMEAGDGVGIFDEKGDIKLKGIDEESMLIIFNLRQ